MRSVVKGANVRTHSVVRGGLSVDIYPPLEGPPKPGESFVKIAKWLIANNWVSFSGDTKWLEEMIPNAKRYDAFYGLSNMRKRADAKAEGHGAGLAGELESALSEDVDEDWEIDEAAGKLGKPEIIRRMKYGGTRYKYLYGIFIDHLEKDDTYHVTQAGRPDKKLGVAKSLKAAEALALKKGDLSESVNGEPEVTNEDAFERRVLAKAQKKADKRLVAQAQEMGAEAFKAGKKSIPIHDRNMMKFLKKHASGDMGSGGVYLGAWTKGWDKANLAAPLPKREGVEDDSLEEAEQFKNPGDRKKVLMAIYKKFKSMGDGQIKGDEHTVFLATEDHKTVALEDTSDTELIAMARKYGILRSRAAA